MDSITKRVISAKKNKFNTTSNRICCVVGCLNTERKNPELKFYPFPSRSHESERKMKWIIAVRRVDVTNKNKLWMPSQNSRICSEHFEGGEKSNDPRKNSYNPTIFPKIYGKAKIDPLRLQRLIARTQKKCEENIENFNEIYNDNENSIEQGNNDLVETRHKEMSVQTDPVLDCNDTENLTLLFSASYNNDLSTQTVIARSSHLPDAKKIIISEVNIERSLSEIERKFKKTVDRSCGPDSKMSTTFSGFDSIQSDKDMKSLGGVSLSMFTILLHFIVPGQDNQPNFFKKLSRHNRLLIFLMKLKLGLSFSALSIIFQISRQSASNIFSNVLSALLSNTRHWLFWPSKLAIKKAMPVTLKNYPNCRVIIDCTEIACNTPPKVEQRILLYSNYKGGFTIKYLIAISPSGLITFISNGYGGRATNSFITNGSGFLNLLEPGDEVLSDKGFPQIRSELLKRQCTLVMPPFALEPQFTKEEVLQGYSIASVRIHVERAIQRIKTFGILKHINIELLPKIDDIMYFICILTNNMEPLIQKK